MSFLPEDIIENLVQNRRHFLKHLTGITEEQINWKPYTECMSIKEIVAHLISDDRAALSGLQSNSEPDYDACQESERDYKKLLSLLEESHHSLISFLRERYGACSLHDPVILWGEERKLGSALAYLSAEDFYHAGQIAYIRLATNPEWDYYAQIYG